MWSIDQTDLSMLLGSGGQPFTKFVDALIRANGFVYDVPDAEILTSLRTSIADGGVDSQVRRAMPSESSGFLRVPTCWQYKARLHRGITDTLLLKEIQKPSVVQLIDQGYAYRLAICDDMPTPKQEAWEQLLTQAARQISPDAPEARVASASQLACWANSYPALLPAFFRRDPGPIQYFEAWTPNITKTTPTFVPVDEWRSATELIQDHIDLKRSAKSPIITLQGVAGVGKTRLVYEILAKLKGAQSLVFYAADGDDAESVGRFLANNPRTRGVLVADECPVHARAAIIKLLKGHSDRVRVVCIDNSGERLGHAQELWLDQLSSAAVETVLESNFPWVPVDRRRSYAAESRGYIRLAAGLCEHDLEIKAKGSFGPAIDILSDYYRERLNDDRQQKVVEAISLLQKVGFGEGVEEELDSLCQFTGLSRPEVLEVAAALKDAPGFVARTTRYLYVTPEIIAKIAFVRAWRRWFASDPIVALSRMPASLVSSFQARIARSATEEVRTLTGQFFWNSIAELKPADLGDEAAVERLARLIDTNPDLYFPRLALLVRNATLKELVETGGPSWHTGTRRTLVWTAERLAIFPKYFTEAEQILRRLALAETEAGIGNNASAVWKALFRIQLSGSATPFSDRIQLLGRLLSSSDPDESALAFDALKEALHFTETRLMGPTLVAGQIVPLDWRPESLEELRNCLKAILGLFNQVLEHGSQNLRHKAWTGLAAQLRSLLAYGMLPALKEVLERRSIPGDYLGNFLQSIEDFLYYECGGQTGSLAEDPECTKVSDWLRELTPIDFEGRLRAAVMKAPWHHSIREELSEIPSEVLPLANEVVANPGKLDSVLPYLNSPDASSAGVFGEALASLDAEARCMDRILSGAAASGSNVLARGYVGRIVRTSPQAVDRLNAWLDQREEDAPELAYFVSLAATEAARPLERTLRMINANKLPVQALSSFIVSVLLDRMSSGELTTVLDLLVKAGDPQSLNIAIDFIGHSLQKRRVFEEAERESMWRALEASALVEDRADYWWVRAIQVLAPEAPERACKTALLGLIGEDFEKRHNAWSILSDLAQTHPYITMERIGELLLNPEHEPRLRIGVRSEFFQAMTPESVENWLVKNGIEGARSIAAHLSPPFLDNQGEPQIHALTEYVLENWGDDEIVFERFAASTHNMQMYSGDIASTHRKEVERARRFLSNPISAVRKWAEREVAIGERRARHWAIQEEERLIE